MDSTKYTPKTVLPQLLRRLGQMVPDRYTGTLEENDLYKSSRTFIMGLNGTGLVTDIVYGICDALSQLLGNTTDIESCDILTLSMTLMFTRLITDALSAEWESAVENIQFAVPKIGRDRDRDYLFEGRFRFYAGPPSEIDPNVAAAAIDLFTRIKSNVKLNHIVHHVLANEVPSDQRSPSHSRHHMQQHSQNLKNAASFDEEKNELNATIAEIDSNCESVLFHLSASNWDEAYAFITNKLKSLKGMNTEEVETFQGLDYLGHLYLDHDRLTQLLKDLSDTALPNIKRTIHRLAVQHFLTESISYWITARASDVVYATNPESPLNKIVEVVFDQIFKYTDPDRKTTTSWVFLSTLVVLIPEHFISHIQLSSDKSAAVRRNKSSSRLTGKKLPYLESLVRAYKSTNIQERTLAATCYITFIRAAAAVSQVDNSNVLVDYGTSLYRELLNAFFGSSDRPQIYANLDYLQSQFVTAFAFLENESMLVDLLPVLRAPTAPVKYQYNIIRGFLNLHTMPCGNDIIYHLLDQNQDVFMSLFVMITNRYVEHDLGQVRKDLVAYNIYVAHCKLMFSLFMSQPSLYFQGEKLMTDFMATAQDFVQAVITATTCSNTALRETAMTFCMHLVTSERLWTFGAAKVRENLDHPVFHLYRAFGMNAKAVGNTVMQDQDLKDSRLGVSLQFMKTYLEARTNLVTTYGLNDAIGKDVSKLEELNERLSVSRTIETCMLVCLCSSHVSNCKLALQTLYVMTREAAAVENFEKANESHWSIMPNYNVYVEISSPDAVVPGAISVQKRLFKWLQLIDDPSPAMVKAWALIYDRWIMISVGSFDNDQEKQREWKSYSGFLCSLLSPLLNLDGHMRIPDNVHFKARQFLKEIIELLLSDSPYVRETVKEVLARDASPLVFHHVFRHLNDMIDAQLTPDRYILSIRDVRLAIQTTALITSVIERLYEGEIYLSVDIGALALKIVHFLKDVEADSELVKLEIRICHLLEVVGYYKDTLNMKHELRVRNEFVMILSEWLEQSTAFKAGSSSDRSTDKSIGQLFSEMERLMKDKAVAVVRALTQLLDGLPIDVPDSVHEKEVLTAKSNIFTTLFSLFLRVLNRVKCEEEGKSDGMVQLGDKIPFVRSQVTLALSNLLNANVDIGLKVALNLGYHDDVNLRLAFLEIFKNILSKGTKFSAEYNENKKYEEMIDLVANNMQISLMLCDVCPPSEVDDFSMALLNAYESRNKSVELVKEVVTREIETTDSPMDILRRNCVATRVLSLFAKSKGAQYLKLALGPFLQKITEWPDDYVFEIEPEKLKDYQEFKDNLNNFEKCLTEVITGLEDTTNAIPYSFREVCHAIALAVEPHFPESKEAAVSGFFFLRFICPALVSPDGEGLLEKAPDKPVRRSLLLLAKCIQNMANGSTNPIRLTVVSDRIAMIERKTETMLKMLREICNVDRHNPGVDQRDEYRELQLMERSYAISLHKFLYSHWEDAHHRIVMDQRMRKLLASKNTTNGENRRRSTSVMGDRDADASRKLTAILRSLGRPPSLYSRQLPTNMRFNTPNRLYEFMTRNSLRDLKPVIDKKIVHEGISIDGVPVLVLTARNFDRDQMDLELVMYRFFQVASKMWSDTFYLFYDGTGSSLMNEFPDAARASSDLMIPDEMAYNCTAMYVFNLQSDQLPRVKSMVRHYQNGRYLNPRHTRYVFLTPDTIGEHFDINSLNLEERTLRVVNDARVCYADVQEICFNKDDREEFFAVSLRLGNEFLQIHGETAFNYIPYSPGYTNDVYHLTEITDIYMSDGHEHEFTIELKNGHKHIMTTSKRYEIIRAIQNAKGRLPQEDEVEPQDESIMRVEDAMGRLLNMGLANLCSNDTSVQLAAYNLLATLPARFDIDFGRELRGGEGLALPKNEITMAVSFSEAVSLSHPELTSQFLAEFFASYKSFSVERRQSTILYVVPWVKNIYPYIYCADEEKGSETTASFIRSCLDITVGNPTDYTCLLLNVWPVLALEEPLADILIHEVIEFVLDRGMEDPQFEDAIAVITSFPTVSICGTMFGRIRKLLGKPMGAAERSLVNHPNWSELTVLIKMLSFLSFESITIAETYLSDVLMLVTTFLYTGNFQFRSTLHGLLVNVVHAFSCSDKLSPERKDHVVSIWHDLTTAKGKLLFGLSDEMRPMNYDYFVLAAVKHIESCCLVLMSLISTVGSADDANVWRARWCSYVIKSCFVECPALQCRSFLVLGCLARIEVEEVVVSQVLQVLKRSLTSSMLSLSEEFAACTLFCLTKMVDGLPANSDYHCKLFWLGLSVARSGAMALFCHAISLIQATMRAMDENGNFKTQSIADYVIEHRGEIEEEWKELDQLNKVKFTSEYFDVSVCASVLRGLERSSTRAPTLKALETFLEISAKNNVKDRRSRNKYPSYLSYLYFLFLGCRSENDMKDLLWVAGYPEDHMPADANADALPTLLREYLSDESTDSTIALFLGGQLFRSCNDFDNMDLRFFNTLHAVGEKNVDKKAMIYSVVRDKVVRLVEYGSNHRVMEAIMDVGGSILANAEMFANLPNYRRHLQSLLIGSGFEGSMVDMRLSDVLNDEEQAGAQQRFASLVAKMLKSQEQE